MRNGGYRGRSREKIAVQFRNFIAMTAFAEIGVTTNFSFLRGASHPKEFVAQAGVAMDTGGWAVLAFEPARGTLANHAVTDRQPLAPGLVPLLAIDIARSDAVTLASRVNGVNWDKP